jgi:hypothetical protein
MKDALEGAPEGTVAVPDGKGGYDLVMDLEKIVKCRDKRGRKSS